MKANNAAARLGGILKTALEISGDRTARTLRAAPDISCVPTTPPYLETVYWWVYLHPRTVWVFERQWLVNAILFGNYARLREVALSALGKRLHGLTIQIACAYGDFTNRLCERVPAGNGRLDVVDVLPTQIKNLHEKLSAASPARLLVMDSGALDLQDARYDRAVLFFLLHEQPDDWRRTTLAEALRVVRPGGRIVIVDYAKPRWWNPLRYALRPVLSRLEPFALDLWRVEIVTFLPTSAGVQKPSTPHSLRRALPGDRDRMLKSIGASQQGADSDDALAVHSVAWADEQASIATIKVTAPHSDSTNCDVHVAI